MNKMQLFVIIFNYENYKCFLPRIFKHDYWSEDKKKEYCQIVVNKLQENEMVKNLLIYRLHRFT